MKKYLPNAHLIAGIFGGIAMALRFWALAGGPDEKGLYPNHFAWPLVCILSLGATAFFWLLSRQTEPKRSYRENFPASPIGAAGALLGALGMAVTGITLFGGDGMDLLCAILALASAGALGYSGYQRLQGRRPHFAALGLVTLFFALRLFSLGKVLGAEPETQRYLFRFLAVVTLLIASYNLWGFALKEGHRQKSLFWSLTAGYLCLAALPGSSDWMLYLGCGIWLLTNLCSLQPERRRREAPVAAEEAPPQPEAANPDQLIEQLLKDLESK